MVTFQLNKKFKGDRIKPNYFLQTSSWDLILNLVQRDSNLVGIVAAPIGRNRAARLIISKCPLVIGSKLPGKIAFIIYSTLN